MSILSHAKLVPAIGCLLVAATVFVLPACGSDHEDPGAGVAAACSSSCNTTAGQCNLPTAPACANLCGLGYSIAPACAANYQSYVECSGASPLLACNGNSVTVSVSVPPCLDQLGKYLTCAVGNIQACFDVPLDNGACTQAKMGPNARACVGQAPAGCTLLAGVQAGTQTGAGVFCCA